MKPSEAELEILQIVWQHQPVTVRTVHELLSHTKNVGYTTTLKQMQRMVEKKMLEKDETEKTQTYKSLINEKETRDQLFNKFLQTTFGGSALELAMHALGKSKVSADELESLKKWIEKKEGQGYD
ncbi:MAG: BlaI/MecI/CopY family transcriptional regulator [Cyclobacteriaceae bacterium]